VEITSFYTAVIKQMKDQKNLTDQLSERLYFDISCETPTAWLLATLATILMESNDDQLRVIKSALPTDTMAA